MLLGSTGWDEINAWRNRIQWWQRWCRVAVNPMEFLVFFLMPKQCLWRKTTLYELTAASSGWRSGTFNERRRQMNFIKPTTKFRNKCVRNPDTCPAYDGPSFHHPTWTKQATKFSLHRHNNLKCSYCPENFVFRQNVCKIWVSDNNADADSSILGYDTVYTGI